MKNFLFLILILFLFGCRTDLTKTNVVSDTGMVVVKNGRGELDTINYTCSGCENLLTPEVFNKITNESTEKAKKNLNNPLSFLPVSINLSISKEDSIISFSDNKKIDSVLSVLVNYEYIGKNAYGTEMGGEQTIILNVVKEEIKDISCDIKLKDLKFEDTYINRTLSGANGSDFIEMIPTKEKFLIVKSSISCVDEGTLFILTLDNGERLELTSWNDFNCVGDSYYYFFNKSQISLLQKHKIEFLSLITSGKSLAVPINKNQSDYIQQLLKLY